MSTPCIVATGTRSHWNGVPCRMDGYESWTGAFLVDRIVREGSAAAARELVTGHGWESVGGEPLTEPDDFLGSDLSNETSPDIFDRHYALYVIDDGRLEVRVLSEDRWLEPAVFGDSLVLPSWYPQLGDRSFSKRRRPEAITRELQEQSRSLGIAWGPVCEALRRWIVEQLGDLTGCSWLYVSGESDEHVRCLIEDTFVYAAVDSFDRCLTGADGKLRRIDIDQLDLAERMFTELGVPASRALVVIEKWLTLAARHGANDPSLRAEWYAGTRRWNIERSGRGGLPMYLPSSGLLPTLLCWLF